MVKTLEKLVSPNGVEYTNITGVPKETAIFAMYLNETGYSGSEPRWGKLSASDLIASPRKYMYKVEYPTTPTIDVATILKSAKGTSHHNSMANALEWYGNGYHTEERIEKEFKGWKISGEYDIKINNTIKDLKHVSNFVYKKLMDEKAIFHTTNSIEEMLELFPTYAKFCVQMSIYRWLHEDMDEIEPFGYILFMLSDGGDFGKYPIDSEVMFPLLPREQIEEFITSRINMLEEHKTANTKPLCNANDRGYNPPEYKLKRVNSKGVMATVRGSKFTDKAAFDEYVRLKAKPGDQEEIQEASYKLCEYCPFSAVCDQE
jgi:hypothetical protein